MMRLLKPVSVADTARLIRLCAQWVKDGLGLGIVEYRIGNAFTGSIDILAVDRSRVYLVTVNTGSLADAILEALTGYRWFCENSEFLHRVYRSGSIDLLQKPVLVLLSPEYPPEIHSVLRLGLAVEFRLFKYLVLGSEDEPELYVEEVHGHGAATAPATFDPAEIRRELGIEKAGLGDDEIVEFLTAVRGH